MSARTRLKELAVAEELEDGVLFAESPAERAAQEKSKRERRRRKIIRELFATEKAYLNHLDLIQKFFYFPLQFNCIIPEDAHSRLFSNIEQIRDVNRTLLELMEQSTVGQAFRHLGPFLKLYATYANNHEQALSVLQEWTHKKPEFAEFITTQESRPEVMGLKINALLITPVQRIPRYKLLLEDLLEHTPIDNHDYLQLKEATQQIGEIAMYINEHIRQHENFQKMLAIQKSFDSSAPKILQPGRLFLKEGQLKKVARKGGKYHDRMFFLFSDMLLYGKPRLLDSGGKSYTCCCVLPIKHCRLERVFVTNVKQSNNSGGGVFKITCKEESLMLFSEDTGVAQSWSDAIEKAIRQANADRQTLRKPSSNKIPLRGRSLRKHRQQQKKAALEMTPVNHQHAAKQEETKGCCSPHLRQRLEPFQARLQNMYNHLPVVCASPPKTKVNRSSVISEGSEMSTNLSSESSQSNLVYSEDSGTFDVFATHEDLNSMTGDFSPKADIAADSLGSTMSTATGVEIYYPHGSVLSLNMTRSQTSVRSKLRSYLKKPFTRLQRAHQQMTSHCSPQPQAAEPRSWQK